MTTLLFALVSVAFAVPAQQTVSVGRVLSVASTDSSVTVSTERDGAILVSEVVVLDAASLATLQPGDTVLVYHESAGNLVVAAR